MFVKLEDLQKFPIRKNHYDKVNGNERFVMGIETVLEYADNLPTYGEDLKPEWISVRERLPVNGRQVLVYGMRGRVCVCRYETRYDKNVRYIKTGFYRNEDKKRMNVRYWMPLPELPKTGKSNKFFSPDEVAKMSPKEVRKNYADVLRSMEGWKEKGGAE